MRHTDDKIERASKRFEEPADELDLATAEVVVTEDLRAIAAAAEARGDASGRDAPPGSSPAYRARRPGLACRRSSRDQAWWVTVLAVTAPLGNLAPAVMFAHLDESSELHRRGRSPSGTRR